MINTEHPHASQIQEMIDGRLDADRARDVRGHCEVCDRCRRVLDSLSSLDRNLRLLPLERTGPAFTATLMNRLNLARNAPAQSRFFELFAFGFGLLLVLAVVASAFLLAGGKDSALDPGMQEILGRAVGALESGMTALGRWIPIDGLFGGSAAQTVVFAIIAIILAALADRVLRRKLIGG